MNLRLERKEKEDLDDKVNSTSVRSIISCSRVILESRIIILFTMEFINI